MDIYVAFAQGNRSHMEDTYCLELNFGGNKDWVFGGVFDGHMGSEVAELAAERMPGMFLEKIKSGEGTEKSFEDSYEEISGMGNFFNVGCTALSFFIKKNEIWVANAGDSRMISLNRRNTEQITTDHRVDNNRELSRVKRAGAKVKAGYVCRGDPGLMPTRSLGDHYFKEVGIIARPDIFFRKIRGAKAAFVAATDGVWDEMENEAVASVVRESESSREAAGVILSICLTGSMMAVDNLTVIVIRNY